VSAGELGGGGVLCFLAGECREVVADIRDVPAGDYSLRTSTWWSGLRIGSQTSQITLDGGETMLPTGHYASRAADEVEVELLDAAGTVVATSGRSPW
jgi:hypothetical protein